MISFPEWKINHDMSNHHAILHSNCPEMIDIVFSKDPILKSFIIDCWVCDGYAVVDIGNLQSLDPFIYKEKDFSNLLTYTSCNDGNGWMLKHENDMLLYNYVKFNSNSFSSAIPMHDDLSSVECLYLELEGHQNNKNRFIDTLKGYERNHEGRNNNDMRKRIENCISELDDRIERLNMIIKISNKELIYDENTKFFVKRPTEEVTI